MNTIQEKLRLFAKNKALNYIMSLEKIKPHIPDLSFVLVGSVATGLCNEHSDVDIALICNQEVFDLISKGEMWEKGRPTEIIIEDTQLHYYAITYDVIKQKMKDFDDLALYVYSNVEVLYDEKNRYQTEIEPYGELNSTIYKTRTEGNLDMLLRRVNALKYCFKHEDDILQKSTMLLEVIKRIVKVVALLDRVMFDPRKRMFNTSLRGELGQSLINDIKSLFEGFTYLSKSDEQHALNNILEDVQSIIEAIKNNASNQNYIVGLEKPDRRFI